MKIIDWTDDKISELVELKEAGKSASHIANVMCSTRNAILGKLNRLGLSKPQLRVSEEEKAERRQKQIKRDTEVRRLKRVEQRQWERPMLLKAPKPKIVPPLFEGYLSIPFGDLRPRRSWSTNQCRFIAAEPPAPDYLACGNQTAIGESWCEHCKGVVYARASTLTDIERASRVKQMRDAASRRPTADEMIEDAA